MLHLVGHLLIKDPLFWLALTHIGVIKEILIKLPEDKFYENIFSPTRVALFVRDFNTYTVRVGHAVVRHCVTRRKVSDSIPDGVIWILHWINSSGRTMALESTQPLKKMITLVFHVGHDGRCVRLTLPPWSSDFLQTLGASTSWSPKGLIRPVREYLYLYLHRCSLQKWERT